MGFPAPALYQAGTEICWAFKEQHRRALPEIRLRSPLANNHHSLSLSSRRQKYFRRSTAITFDHEGFPEHRRPFGRAGKSGDANSEVVPQNFPRAILIGEILHNFQIPVYRPRLIVSIAPRNQRA